MKKRKEKKRTRLLPSAKISGRDDLHQDLSRKAKVWFGRDEEVLSLSEQTLRGLKDTADTELRMSALTRLHVSICLAGLSIVTAPSLRARGNAWPRRKNADAACQADSAFALRSHNLAVCGEEVVPSVGRWSGTCKSMMVWKMTDDRQVVVTPDS
eukprot:s5067_g8.t1